MERLEPHIQQPSRESVSNRAPEETKYDQTRVKDNPAEKTITLIRLSQAFRRRQTGIMDQATFKYKCTRGNRAERSKNKMELTVESHIGVQQVGVASMDAKSVRAKE